MNMTAKQIIMLEYLYSDIEGNEEDIIQMMEESTSSNIDNEYEEINKYKPKTIYSHSYSYSYSYSDDNDNGNDNDNDNDNHKDTNMKNLNNNEMINVKKYVSQYKDVIIKDNNDKEEGGICNVDNSSSDEEEIYYSSDSNNSSEDSFEDILSIWAKQAKANKIKTKEKLAKNKSKEMIIKEKVIEDDLNKIVHIKENIINKEEINLIHITKENKNSNIINDNVNYNNNDDAIINTENEIDLLEKVAIDNKTLFIRPNLIMKKKVKKDKIKMNIKEIEFENEIEEIVYNMIKKLNELKKKNIMKNNEVIF